ncbi:GNAT family N-acetyltransferase [Flavonifractor sp. An100]|uniref:GNAT family N-acetyltransferase n=1 Tax=Flavonifractor sp. An100 TaxID=1965538 RepID=UPI000B37AD3F|nr:GNAT family N-acetyltransferase [Flavonifractor sp. An100]OUQ78897.1 GNAT family N-acetyltransferase [Flavonifractor sp. An100]
MNLDTPRLLLRPFVPEDKGELYDYAKDPRVGPAAGWSPHKSQAESLEIIQTVFSAPNVFAVVDRQSGRVIGSAGYTGRHRPEFPAPDGEIGYSLHPDFWGRGLMGEAMEVLLRLGFEELEFASVWCSHYTENHRSRRVIEKSGLRFQMEALVLDEPTGKEKPARFYVITREDWMSRRG